MTNAELAYYGLNVRSQDSVDIVDEWYGRNYPPTLWCSECGEAHSVSESAEPLPIDTKGGRVGFQLPLEHLSGINYEVVRGDLLTAFGPEARQHLNLGTLLDENGKLIPNYYTAQARTAAVVRGGPESGDNGVCPSCGTRNYYPMPPGYGYLLRSSFPPDIPILRIQTGCFAVNQEIRDRIKAVGLDNEMFMQSLTVRDEPEDGRPLNMKFCERA